MTMQIWSLAEGGLRVARRIARTNLLASAGACREENFWRILTLLPGRCEEPEILRHLIAHLVPWVLTG
jgi:hypothetical protein